MDLIKSLIKTDKSLIISEKNLDYMYFRVGNFSLIQLRTNGKLVFGRTISKVTSVSD